MLLRPYSHSDFETCVTLLHEVYKQTYPNFAPQYLAKERFYEIMSNYVLPRNDVFVVCEQETLLAFAAIHNNFLDQLYVAQAFQGRGIGSMLIRHAKEINPKMMELYTFAQNTRAIAFYQKHGFRIVAHGIAPDEQEPDVLMRWEKI